MAAGTTITNWFGDLVSHPRVVVEAASAGYRNISAACSVNRAWIGAATVRERFPDTQ